MSSPTNPIDLLTRLRMLRPQREQREPVMIPPVQQLSDEYDSQFEDGPALSSYREHIQSMPEYQDYQPSIGRRLISGLVGAGLGARSPQQGIKFAEDFNQQPYHEAASEWNMRTAPLREGAQLEELGQRTKRKYIDDARETALKQQHYQNQDEGRENEFDRKLIDIERSYLDQQSRGADRDEDRAVRAEDIKQRGLDRNESRADRRSHNAEMERIARGNLDVKKNPPPRPTAPLRITPERQKSAYGQAMRELTDNPSMADFVERRNGKITGFRESAGGMFTAKRKPSLTFKGKQVSPADWVRARTEEILSRMNEPADQFEDLGFDPGK